MGTIQNQLNSALGSWARMKIGKGIIQGAKDIKDIKIMTEEEYLENKMMEEEVEKNTAIHEEQMARINKPDAKSGEQVYVPEDLSSDPTQMGPMPYTPALFGADGFLLHNPKLAQTMSSEHAEQGGMNALREAQRAIDIKNMRKQFIKQRWEEVLGGNK